MTEMYICSLPIPDFLEFAIVPIAETYRDHVILTSLTGWRPRKARTRRGRREETRDLVGKSKDQDAVRQQNFRSYPAAQTAVAWLPLRLVAYLSLFTHHPPSALTTAAPLLAWRAPPAVHLSYY